MTSASWSQHTHAGGGGVGGGWGGWDFPLTHLNGFFIRVPRGRAVGPVLPVLETKGLHAERLEGNQYDSWTDTQELHTMQSDVTCLFGHTKTIIRD